MLLSNLSAILGRKKLTISQLSKISGVSRPTLTKLYYNSALGINFDTLNKLCASLSITPNELLVFSPIEVQKITINMDKLQLGNKQLAKFTIKEGLKNIKQGKTFVQPIDFLASGKIELTSNVNIPFNISYSGMACLDEKELAGDCYVTIDIPKSEAVNLLGGIVFVDYLVDVTLDLKVTSFIENEILDTEYTLCEVPNYRFISGK